MDFWSLLGGGMGAVAGLPFGPLGPMAMGGAGRAAGSVLPPGRQPYQLPQDNQAQPPQPYGAPPPGMGLTPAPGPNVPMPPRPPLNAAPTPVPPQPGGGQAPYGSYPMTNPAGRADVPYQSSPPAMAGAPAMMPGAPGAAAGAPGGGMSTSGSILADWSPLNQQQRAIDQILQGMKINPDSQHPYIQALRRAAERIVGTETVNHGTDDAWLQNGDAQLASIGQRVQALLQGQRALPTGAEGMAGIQSLMAAGQNGAGLGNQFLQTLLNDPQQVGNLVAALGYGQMAPELARIAAAPLQRAATAREDALRNETFRPDTASTFLQFLLNGGTNIPLYMRQ